MKFKGCTMREALVTAYYFPRVCRRCGGPSRAYRLIAPYTGQLCTRCAPERCRLTDHARGCRPGRPLCAAMRALVSGRRPCRCLAYAFPHRRGSGLCDPARMARAYEAAVYERGQLFEARHAPIIWGD